MLVFRETALRRGPRLLFEGASFTIHTGHTVGVTGANGSGKSSLFALVRGELHADAGDVTLPPRTVIASVAQENEATKKPAVEYVMDGDTDLRATEAVLAEAEAVGDGEALGRAHAHLDAIDGYTAHSRAARLMHGLGFAAADEDSPVMSFSGGWRMRLNLAQALMCRSDLLLLDEPTNHLDLDAVIWLEGWLRSYAGTLLLISHDRDFLDAVVGGILHVDNQQVTSYSGNYSAFERTRAERMAAQHAAYEKQQREIAHIRRFVDRFRAKATKARQAQSRLKTLERMEAIAPAHLDSPFRFGFDAPSRLPDPLLKLERAAAGYDAHRVLDGVRLSLRPGDRIGLLGANGAGKSTLVKLIAGELTPDEGEREATPELAIGYFAQHQLEQLRLDESPLRHMQRLDENAREQALRTYLGGFGFRGDRVTDPIATGSGGEKARLVLALIVYQRPALLLLDEPTNHLDLEMRHALTVALQEFTGALVLVSHDRHLLRAATDELLLVDDGKVTTFDGDLADYARWLAKRERASEPVAQAAPMLAAPTLAAPEDRKMRRQQGAEQRRLLQPMRSEVQRLERLVATLEQEKAGFDAALGGVELYQAGAKQQLQEQLEARGQVERRLRDAEAQWLSASEALEAAEDGTAVGIAG